MSPMLTRFTRSSAAGDIGTDIGTLFAGARTSRSVPKKRDGRTGPALPGRELARQEDDRRGRGALGLVVHDDERGAAAPPGVPHEAGDRGARSRIRIDDAVERRIALARRLVLLAAA